MECSFTTPPKARAKATRAVSYASERATATSGTPGRGSRLSERRYTFDSDTSLLGEVSVSERSSVESCENIFEIPFNLHIKTDPSKHRRVPSQPELRTAPFVRHSRSSSHQRRPSISFAAEATYDEVLKELKTNPQTPSNAEGKTKQRTHVRTASELDSVVYLGPNESMSSQPESRGLSIGDSIELERTITRRPQKPPRKSSIADVLRTSLPSLGAMPSSAFCPNCKCDTHTQVGFKGDKSFSSTILRALSPFLACCAVPSWLSSLRVHFCSQCKQVLARA
mmetsp:Transcript_5725/g.10228  ORF Transcript_5725/g.10228 Transcript_5725/m.10228 type:complete len:281 (-) Transcript_5725:62-904(-)